MLPIGITLLTGNAVYMIGYFTPLLILQAVCLYHAYRTHAEQRWYWLIAFFPGIGCAIYIIHNFNSRPNIQAITEGVKVMVNSNYKVEQLEAKLKFSDNITNKTNLANEYVLNGRYAEAIALYKECLTGYMADDPALTMKVMQACYLNKNYEEAIAYGKQLVNEKAFKNAEERSAYAWSFHYTGQTAKAEEMFNEMDKSFTNYKQRIEYGKFLKLIGKKDELSSLVATLQEELSQMKGPSIRLHRDVRRDVNELYSGLAR